MHDYKYDDLLHIAGARRDMALNPRSQCLREVSASLFENICRIDSFCMFPAELIVRLKTGSSVNQLGPALGVQYINERLVRGDIGVIQSIEALLSSAVIESWTTFETFAADLWIAAVNGGPPEFAQRINAATASSKEMEEAIPKGWKEKLVYDPRKNFPESLVEVGKVSFTRLDRIIYWYAATFEGSVRKLFKDVEDGYIHALSAYRNALVHKGGKVDKPFIARIEPVDNLRGKFQEGDKLKLDGELVRTLRNSGIVLSQRLILFVDDLITPVPPI